MQYILTMHCENMHWPRTARKLLSAGNTPVIPQALTLSIDPTFRSKFGCDHQMRIAPAHLRIPPELVESHRKCYHREVQNTTEEKANVGVAACTKVPVAFRKMWKAVPTHFLSLSFPLCPLHQVTLHLYLIQFLGTFWYDARISHNAGLVYLSNCLLWWEYDLISERTASRLRYNGIGRRPA